MMIKDRPRRLDRIFSRAPIFFVTFCTRDRRRVDPLDQVKAAFITYCVRGLQEYNVGIGRYVIMPDRVHFFVRGGSKFCVLSVGGRFKASDVRCGIQRIAGDTPASTATAEVFVATRIFRSRSTKR
jgi:REP element-mobilizing transposase RayT